MKVEVEGALFCPACGAEIRVDDPERNYCPHVQFVYGFFSADEDGYVYVNPSFGQTVLRQQLSKKKYRSALRSLSEKDIANFLSGEFSPLGETAKMIPYCGDITDITFHLDFGYSGASIGINTVLQS